MPAAPTLLLLSVRLNLLTLPPAYSCHPGSLTYNAPTLLTIQYRVNVPFFCILLPVFCGRGVSQVLVQRSVNFQWRAKCPWSLFSAALCASTGSRTESNKDTSESTGK